MRYSQNEEEDLIKQHFGETVGAVLDIGANDGKTLSNSLACIERGWNATLVEPSVKCFDYIKKLHLNNDKVEAFNVAISDRCGIVEFFESGEHAKQFYGENHGLLSSLKKDETIKWKEEKFTTTIVQAIDIKTLIKISKFKRWDLISIDAEGFDYEILRQIDLTDCKMLIVETNGVDDNKYIDYCSKFGMKIHFKTYQNLILAK